MPLAAIVINQTALNAAHQRPDAGRMLYVHGLGAAQIRRECKRAGCRIDNRGGRHPADGLLDPGRGKRPINISGQIIADVLGVDGHNPVQRLADIIDPERLRIICVVRFCYNQAPQRDISIMGTGDRIGHLQLIGPVPVLLNLAGDGAGQYTDAERCPCRCIRVKQNRMHRTSLNFEPARSDRHPLNTSRESDRILSWTQDSKLARAG